MDVLPPALPAVPYSGLFRLAGARAALAVHKLRQADVGDAGGVVPDDVHVRVEDGGVDGLAVLGEHWRGKGRLWNLISEGSVLFSLLVFNLRLSK